VAGAAAFVIGAVAVRVACPIDEPLHVVAWHLGPVVPWMLVSGLLGSLWLARWRAGSTSGR